MSAASLIPGLQGPAQTLPGGQPANIVADRTGKILASYTPPAGRDVSNFRTQIYQGRKVLTWWQGSTVAGHGSGVGIIADENFHTLATVDPGGAGADVHEFRLTPDGHALVTSYSEVDADLTAISGPANARMYAPVALFVDVAIGKELSRRISEFTPTGELLYDAVLPFGTYRAYLDTWPLQ
ncbi:arylsulfotransferase family protein [Nocardia sp. NPDC004123]